MPALRPTDGGVLIDIRLSPRSSRNAILGLHDERYKIAVTAPPVDNEANQRLLRFLAKTIGVPASALEIRIGAASRSKTVFVKGIDVAGVEKKLA